MGEPRALPPAAAFLATGTVNAAVERAQGTLRAVFRSERVASYAQALVGFDRLSGAYAIAALRALGLDRLGPAPVPAATIAITLDVAPRFTRLLDRLLTMLAMAGVARRDDRGWHVGPLPAVDPEAIRAEIACTHPWRGPS